MAGTTAEIYQFTVPVDLTIGDTTSVAGQAWSALLSGMKSAKGSGNVYWGRKVEDEGTVVLVVEWNDSETNLEALKSIPIASSLAAIAKLGPTIASRYRVDFKQALDVPLTSPTTEFSVAYFPTTSSESDLSAFESTTANFMESVSHHPQSSKGFASGWTTEDVSQQNDQNAKAFVKAFVSALGWDSMEAHYAFNTTDTVRKNVGGIAAGGATGWDILHIKAVKA